MMVQQRRSEEVIDPNLNTKPSTSALKRTLLTALRCVDPLYEKRPRMSQVARMLESEEYPIPREDPFWSLVAEGSTNLRICRIEEDEGAIMGQQEIQILLGTV
ncbi:hypothetical protein Bca4012_048116 [Brassica carinata]|uniref:non-specific serine/threonine protein kinase n=1 Tax=Brassica carinata TaxID=52824 RepID=A0A8X7R285_BRACI|nr:hypothetical protein Bca52824_051073 [Brassica carinata]